MGNGISRRARGGAHGGQHNRDDNTVSRVLGAVVQRTRLDEQLDFEDPVYRHRAVPHSERDRDAGAGGSKLLLGKQNTAYYVKTI